MPLTWQSYGNMSDLKLSFRCLLSVGVYKLCCGRKVEHDVGKSSKRKSTRLNPLQGGRGGAPGVSWDTQMLKQPYRKNRHEMIAEQFLSFFPKEQWCPRFQCIIGAHRSLKLGKRIERDSNKNKFTTKWRWSLWNEERHEFLLHTLSGNHEGCQQLPSLTLKSYHLLLFSNAVHLLPFQLLPSAVLSMIHFLWPNSKKNKNLNFEPALLPMSIAFFEMVMCNKLSYAGPKMNTNTDIHSQ